MMNDYLRSLDQQAGAQISTASSSRSTITVCAQDIYKCTMPPDFFTNAMACAPCPGLSPSASDIGSVVSGSGGQLGSCVYTETPYGAVAGVPGTTNVGISGTFINTCHLKGGCGHPLCEDIVLTTTGVRYFVTGAVSFTDPGITQPSGPGSGPPEVCPPAPARSARSSSSAGEAAPGLAHTHAQTAAASGSEAHSASVRYSYGDDGTFVAPANVYVGNAFVYFGVMNVASRSGGCKYETGFFQFAYFDSWNTTTVPYISLPPGRPVFQDHGFQIQFVSRSDDAGNKGGSKEEKEEKEEEEEEEARAARS